MFNWLKKKGETALYKDTEPLLDIVPIVEKDHKKITEVEPEDNGVQDKDVEHRVQLLEKHPSLNMAYDEILNFDLKFSKIDGSDLRTNEARLAQAEKLQQLTAIDLEWYERRSGIAYFAEASKQEFVSEKGIQELLDDGVSTEDALLKMHWWQLAGSHDQDTVQRNFGYNMAGQYRENNVGIGMIPPPDKKYVEVMMKLLVDQIDTFSAQLEEFKSVLSQDEFEERVMQLASYAMHRLVEIHPMADGNGRTARALYEYIVVKHAGGDSKYRHLPKQDKPMRQIKYNHGRIVNAEFNDDVYSINIRYDAEIDTEIEKRDTFELSVLRQIKQDDITTAVFEKPVLQQLFADVKNGILQPDKDFRYA